MDFCGSFREFVFERPSGRKRIRSNVSTVIIPELAEFDDVEIIDAPVQITLSISASVIYYAPFSFFGFPVLVTGPIIGILLMNHPPF